jgi:hypothetical protein
VAIAVSAPASAEETASASAQGETAPVTIAVRTDARPFAWQAADNPESFGGYLVDICIDATTRAGFHFNLVPIDAFERENMLKGEFELDDLSVDLLCDPTTITLARLDRLAEKPESQHAVFSPILFVANGSYVQHRTSEPCSLAEPVADDLRWCNRKLLSAEEGVVVLEDRKCLRPPSQGTAAEVDEYLLAGYVRGTTADRAIERAVQWNRVPLRPNQTLCLVAAPSHTDGIGRLCRGELHFYFGDMDIIEAYRAEQAQACEIVRAEAPLSYEPYALLVPSKNPAFRAKFVAAIYEIFADGTAPGRFEHHFEGLERSTALTMLYRINSIPNHRPPAPSDQGDLAPGPP